MDVSPDIPFLLLDLVKEGTILAIGAHPFGYAIAPYQGLHVTHRRCEVNSLVDVATQKGPLEPDGVLWGRRCPPLLKSGFCRMSINFFFIV